MTKYNRVLVCPALCSRGFQFKYHHNSYPDQSHMILCTTPCHYLTSCSVWHT